MALFTDSNRQFWRDEYSLLLSALPRLPNTLGRKPLPLSSTRLWSRLDLLQPHHHQLLRQLIQVVSWGDKPLAQASSLIEDYRRLQQTLAGTALQALLQQRMDLRTLVAALFYRQHSFQPPAGEWTPSGLQTTIVRQWHKPDFGLGRHYPWLVSLAQELEQYTPVDVEKTLFEWLLGQLVKHPQRGDYNFVAVVIYWMHWDLLDRWGRYQAAAAAQRLQQLVDQGLSVPAYQQFNHRLSL